MNFKRTLIGCFSILFAAPFFARAMDPINVSSISLNEKKESLPASNDEENQCSICFESTKDKKGITTPCCRKKYCNECIEKSLKYNDACPTCRETDLKQKIKVMKYFYRQGFIDVRDLPETKDKSYKEILEFLKNNYPNFRFSGSFMSEKQCNNEFYWIIVDQNSKQILVKISGETFKLGICDTYYFDKNREGDNFWKMFEIL